MSRMKNLLSVLTLLFTMSLSAVTAYAGTEYARLYFFTADGYEIEELSKYKKMQTNKKAEYTFRDPQEYIFADYEQLVSEGEGHADDPEYVLNNGMKASDVLSVNAVGWVEISEDGRAKNGKQYAPGEKIELGSGDYMFRVVTDKPELTSENISMTSNTEHAELIFYDDAGNEIEDLHTEIMGRTSGGYYADTFTFPDPAAYTKGEYKGIYWQSFDANGEVLLFSNAGKGDFKPGVYEWTVVTDEPVNVYFHYPWDAITITDEMVADIVDEGEDRELTYREPVPGDIYYQTTAVLGDHIKLLSSLGAVTWGKTFRGWELEGEDGFLKAGDLYRIINNQDLHFYAYYEEDDNWDPFAKDQNGVVDDSKLVRTAKEVNAIGGDSYGAYIENGKLRRSTGGQKINNHIALNGIPGLIPLDKNQFAFKDPENADITDKDYIKDPDNYAKTADGLLIEDLNLTEDLDAVDVLMQHNGAQYMDIFGNSFVYHSDLTRLQDMCLAYARYNAGLTPGFAQLVANFDQEALERQRAIEFALLSGQYPDEANSYYKQFNSDNAAVVELKKSVGLNGDERLPEWKNSYLSKTAFEKIAYTKQIWFSGWLSSYTDGLYEKLKQQNTGNVRRVSDATPTKNPLKDLFFIEAYADELNNTAADAAQVGTQLIYTIDVNGRTFPKQYFDPNKMYSFTSFSFIGLTEPDEKGYKLTTEQVTVLKQIFDALTAHGYSTQMAAGACGNLWQESWFKPDISGVGGAYGLIQWTGDRKNKLLAKADDMGLSWKEPQVQIAYMIDELTSSYDAAINDYLNKVYHDNGATNFRTVADVDIACEAWCVAVEGCSCYNPKTGERWDGSRHNADCAPVTAQLKYPYYQHLKQRKRFAHRIYNAMVFVGGVENMGSFAGMRQSEILASIFGHGVTSMQSLKDKVDKGEINWNRDVAAHQRTFTLHNGKSLTVHEQIATDMEAALNQIIDLGFPIIKLGGYGGYDRVNANNSSRMSFHAPGLAVDINEDQNPNMPKGTTWLDSTPDVWSKRIVANGYNPLKDPYAITSREANILMSHGFGWGRDWGKGSALDFMHFSLGETSNPGQNKQISEVLEGSYYSVTSQ